MVKAPAHFILELGDWPGGTLSATDCLHPDSIDGGLDLCLPRNCAEHGRSIWWCLNLGVLWCDGGPPHYDHHSWPAD